MTRLCRPLTSEAAIIVGVAQNPGATVSHLDAALRSSPADRATVRRSLPVSFSCFATLGTVAVILDNERTILCIRSITKESLRVLRAAVPIAIGRESGNVYDGWDRNDHEEQRRLLKGAKGKRFNCSRAPRRAPAKFEQWLIDQSNSPGMSHGGALYVYDGEDLMGRTPQARRPSAVAGWTRSMWQIVLQQMRIGLLAARVLVFVLAFGELGVSVRVAPLGEATLPIRSTP